MIMHLWIDHVTLVFGEKVFTCRLSLAELTFQGIFRAVDCLMSLHAESARYKVSITKLTRLVFAEFILVVLDI